MKKIITGLVLITAPLSNAHVHADKAQAIESLKARVVLLQAELSKKVAEEKQLAAQTAKQGQETRSNSLENNRKMIKDEIRRLENALQVSKNSIKSLQPK